MSSRIAVLVHFNRPESCLATVRSLVDDEPGLRIVVVDNRSAEASYQKLTQLLRGRLNCSVVRSRNNIGYAGVLARADSLVPELRGEGVIFFGAHDVEVAPGTVRALEAAVVESRAALAFAARLPYEVGRWSPIRGPRYSPLAPPGADSSKELIAGLFFPTPFLAIDRRLWSDGLRPDPALFCYREECDLGLKARAAGLRSFLVPQAMVKNRESGGISTSGLVGFYCARNAVLLASWHAGRGYSLLAAARWLASGLRSASSPSAAERACGRARIAGALRGLRGGGVPAVARRDDTPATGSPEP